MMLPIGRRIPAPAPVPVLRVRRDAAMLDFGRKVAGNLAEPLPVGGVVQREREKDLPCVISYIHSPASTLFQEVWLLFPDFIESLENLGSDITGVSDCDAIGVRNFSKIAHEMEIQSHCDLTASAAVGR
jgi:hypothetical protein